MSLTLRRAGAAFALCAALLLQPGGRWPGARAQDEPPATAAAEVAPAGDVQQAVRDLRVMRLSRADRRRAWRGEKAQLEAEIRLVTEEGRVRADELAAARAEAARSQPEIDALRAATIDARSLADEVRATVTRLSAALTARADQGLDWRREERVAAARDLTTGLTDEPEALADALRRALALLDREIALGRFCEAGEEQVTPPERAGETLLLPVVRVGGVALVALDEARGHCFLQTVGSREWMAIADPRAAGETAAALRVLRKQRTPEPVTLPLPLPSPLAPRPSSLAPRPAPAAGPAAGGAP
ncbi:MAG: DUF3450 family protein [Planctomycetes bacterium]|nr:DUF3450 family protein [Planctomycetota bacterium]